MFRPYLLASTVEEATGGQPFPGFCFFLPLYRSLLVPHDLGWPAPAAGRQTIQDRVTVMARLVD